MRLPDGFRLPPEPALYAASYRPVLRQGRPELDVWSVPFALGALVYVLAGRRPWRARLYVPLAPLTLYAVWWLGWGHTANSSFSLHNLSICGAIRG